MILERALAQYCQGKDAQEAFFTITDNIDLILTVANILYHDGEEAQTLREIVRELRVDLELKLEDQL